MQSGVFLTRFGHRLLVFFICSAWSCVKELETITLCFMRQNNFRPSYFLITMLIFFTFLHTKLPFDRFNLNPFKHQQVQHFGILNYEKQHKEGLCKFLGRSVVFSAFYADFCLCPKSVIIITLTYHDSFTFDYIFSRYFLLIYF